MLKGIFSSKRSGLETQPLISPPPSPQKEVTPQGQLVEFNSTQSGAVVPLARLVQRQPVVPSVSGWRGGGPAPLPFNPRNHIEQEVRRIIERNAPTNELKEYKKKFLDGKNPHEVLLIHENSSREDIEAAYEKIADKVNPIIPDLVHPDNMDIMKNITHARDQMLKILELKEKEKSELSHKILGVTENADQEAIETAFLSKLDKKDEYEGMAKEKFVEVMTRAYGRMVEKFF